MGSLSMMGSDAHTMLQQQVEEELRQLADTIKQREHTIAMYRSAPQEQQMNSSKPYHHDGIKHQQTYVAGNAFKDSPGVEGRSPEISYAAALKAQASKLALALRRKEEMVQALRLQAKFTRLEEVEIEASTYIREAARLRAKLNAGSDVTGNSKFAGRIAALERMHVAAIEEYEKARGRYQSRYDLAHQGWSTLEQKLEVLYSDMLTLVQGSSELVIRYESGRESATLLSFAAAQPTPASTATAHSDKKMDRRAGCELVLLEDELEGVNRQISDGHAQQQEQDKALSLKQHDAIKHLAEGRQELAALRHQLAQLEGRAQALTKELRVCERQLALERKHAQAAEDRAVVNDNPHKVLESTASHSQQPPRHSAASTNQASTSGNRPKVPTPPWVGAVAVPPARRGADGLTSRSKTPATAPPKERSLRKGARQTYRYDRNSPPRGEMSIARYDHLTAKHRSKLNV